MSNEALTFIEIDIPHCSLEYGVAPCTASLSSSPPTGTEKCFNCLTTCQDVPNFTPADVTLRFAMQSTYLPRDIDVVSANLLSVDYTPAIVSLGENLGQRANLKATLIDHPHSDTMIGFDKYYDERSYDPYSQGTLWGKFKSRYPYLRGHELRWITGFTDQSLSEMETRYFFIESVEGPDDDGKFFLVAKDTLKFLDGDRAQAPVLSNGFLVAGIDDNDTEITLSPSGIGDQEYDGYGYINIGGNEVAYYTRDPYTKLLLHFNGSDASTLTSDTDVANPHAVTFFGSAQLDTSQSKFGTASLQLGASGNYISIADSDDWFLGTGNFTIDFHVRFTTVPSGAPNGTIDNSVFFQAADNANGVYCYFDGTAIVFFAETANVAQANYSATHGMLNNTWHHFRLVRSGTSFFIFKDGVALSLTTTTAISTNSLLNTTAALIIGGSTVAGPGWIDEFRWRKGIADSTSGFTAPTAEYVITGVGDVLRLTRGQFNTTAASHEAHDRAQLCLRYNALPVDQIIDDLISNYTDTPLSYLPLTEWETEVSTNLPSLYSALIVEPTSVAKLVSELIQQGPLAMWDDNLEQKLRLQVLRGVPTTAYTFDESTAIENSLSVDEQPEKRVTQVWVYYAQINPTKRVEDPDNYRSVSKSIDDESEANFGAASIIKVYARWIPALGSSIAETLGSKILSRFTTAPRKFAFEVMRRNVDVPGLGSGYRLEWWNFQEANGSRSSVPIQVTRLKPSEARIKVDAEEMLFSASEVDLTNRQIVIDSNTNNVNLQQVHDSLFPALEPGQTVTCTVAEGVIVGSIDTSLPSFDVGTWSGSPTINIIVEGRIQGKGGNGGTYPGGFANGQAGRVGGPALYTRQAVNLTDTNGELFGGGGGGGSGGVFIPGGGGAFSGGGGGGGAGQVPGTGGSGASGLSGTSNAGNSGTTEVGGTDVPKANHPTGGDGGGPGLAGTAGQTVNTFGGAGGSPGLAIDGISYVTTVGGAGDRRGGTAN